MDFAPFERVMNVVRTSARHLVGADGVTFIMRQGDHCVYVEEDAIGPLWKGQRFPLERCVSGWVMLNSQPTVIPDIGVDPRVPQDAYRSTFVRSMAMVPVGSPPLGAIGAYWATRHEATENELDTLKAIAESALIQVGETLQSPRASSARSRPPQE
jgi:two-component system CheB/CheR fusion protein